MKLSATISTLLVGNAAAFSMSMKSGEYTCRCITKVEPRKERGESVRFFLDRRPTIITVLIYNRKRSANLID
jgi:hypothetical protein